MSLDPGRSFAKQVVGTEPIKTAQSTIKILELDFSLDVTHFLAEIKEFWPFLTEVVGLNTKLHPWLDLKGLGQNICPLILWIFDLGKRFVVAPGILCFFRSMDHGSYGFDKLQTKRYKIMTSRFSYYSHLVFKESNVIFGIPMDYEYS